MHILRDWKLGIGGLTLLTRINGASSPALVCTTVQIGTYFSNIGLNNLNWPIFFGLSILCFGGTKILQFSLNCCNWEMAQPSAPLAKLSSSRNIKRVIQMIMVLVRGLLRSFGIHLLKGVSRLMKTPLILLALKARLVDVQQGITRENSSEGLLVEWDLVIQIGQNSTQFGLSMRWTPMLIRTWFNQVLALSTSLSPKKLFISQIRIKPYQYYKGVELVKVKNQGYFLFSAKP